MASRRDFLSQPAPENYVAGLGRGATGFTTRSDLGPAREGPSEDQIKAAVAKRSKELGLTEGKDDDKDDDAERYQDPDNEVGLFAGGIYEKDDEEADRIWKDVDDKMAKRRQKQRLVPFLSVITSTIPSVTPPPVKHVVYQSRQMSRVPTDNRTGNYAKRPNRKSTSARTQRSSSNSPG
jgi:pre-mRNA-processing factor 6